MAGEHGAGQAQATQIVVIRHGETHWNSERRMQGQTNSVLSDRGRAQARAVGKRMRGEAFDVLYSSDLIRAHDTAKAIAEQTGHEIRLDPRLRERGFGIFEGLLRDEMQARHPQEYARFLARDPDYTVPGGETPRAFYERVMGCFEDLARRHPGERVITVAHGLLLDSLYRASLGLDLMAKRDRELINASVNTFRYLGGRWEMVAWGDTSHLDEVTVFQEGGGV
jgi:probable phosphoglycerate mutase